ncbi:zinc transporter ZIP1-like [Ylistrum balloti]|uniref:zinc transporter ZIP1-like n=1 Tax=Ylistrum balloti TaxID=509963 RepID=UPI002905CDD6|nr:zinc transporter ZIP1-like [Ylistrum balloti]
MIAVAKIGTMALLLGLTFTFGITPLWLLKLMSNRMNNLSRLQYFVSLLNCFAGGVFLGTSILHLIQESMETVAESLPEVEYPLSGVLIGAGFFIVLGLEHIIGLASKGNDSPFLDHGHEHGTNDKNSVVLNKIIQTSQNRECNGKTNSTFVEDENKDEELRSVTLNKPEKVSFGKKETQTEGEQAVTPEMDNKDTNLSSMDLPGDSGSKTTKRIRTIILVIALSIHMVFEGMAIGFQDTEVDLWTLAIAISIHKVIVVFSVCMKMREIIDSNVQIIIYILYLASVSPIGIAIGLAISSSGSTGSTQDIISGILQSLAAGTFVYVTFFEILQKELTNGYSMLKVFLTFIGFGAMAALKLLDKD